MGQKILMAIGIMHMANDVLGEVAEVSQHYQAGRDYISSEEYDQDLIAVRRIEKMSSFVMVFMMVLWAILIIGTIYLCVTGNDIVLRLLHL